MEDGNASLIRTIEDVKSAEEKAKQIKTSAEEKAQKILISSKKEAEEIKLKGEKEALELKEKRISEGKKITETEVTKIIGAAQKKAESIKKKKADSKAVSVLINDFVNSFK